MLQRLFFRLFDFVDEQLDGFDGPPHPDLLGIATELVKIGEGRYDSLNNYFIRIASCWKSLHGGVMLISYSKILNAMMKRYPCDHSTLNLLYKGVNDHWKALKFTPLSNDQMQDLGRVHEVLH